MLGGRSLIITAPASVECNEYLNPPVQVEVQRNGIREIALVAGDISLHLSGPYPGVLAGQQVSSAAGGLATFNPLSVNVPGLYMLEASIENQQLLYVTGASQFWRLILPPGSIYADPTYIGYWINIEGIGIPYGIWAKIIDIGSNQWILEQPSVGPTSLSVLAGSMATTNIRYNAVSPLTQPSSWLGIGTHTLFQWSPLGGENYFSFNPTPVTDTLIDDVQLEVLRHVSLTIVAWPLGAKVNEKKIVTAVIRNQGGMVATDLNNETANLEIRSGSTPVYATTVPVVNGYVSTSIQMPEVPGTYSIWIQYQGAWYKAAPVSDAKSVVVTQTTTNPDPDPDPEPDPEYPEKQYGLSAGGCQLVFIQTDVQEYAAPDPTIEVLVK